MPEANFPSEVTPEGEPFRPMAETPRADRTAIMPEYFRTIGIQLLAGREFTADDREPHPHVAIITSTMASQFWPHENALGKRFCMLAREDLERFLKRNPKIGVPWIEVVGIVADVRHAGLAAAPRALIYLPHQQWPWGAAQLIVRTTGDPAALASVVREDARATNPHAIITRVQTMEQAIDDSTAAPRLSTWVATLFAAVGALLASLGLYGVMAHGVLARTREIAIRVALGAPRGRVLALILRHGVSMTLAGIAVGLAGLAVASRVLRQLDTLLYETSSADPFALSAALLLLIGVALVAAYVPARRAMQVDPLVALRDD
jgi:putative ABC transport system permease protein